MQYLQQPSSHRQHAQPAHSLHHAASGPFVSSSGGGGGTLLGQHLRSAVTHRSNAAVASGAFASGTATHPTNDAFQPSLCELACSADSNGDGRVYFTDCFIDEIRECNTNT